MKDYPFVNCLEPKRVLNKHLGEWITVQCGHCEACLQSRSSLATLRCQLESQSHKYCYFVTLTYSNAYIPLAACVRAGEETLLVNVTDRLQMGVGEILGSVTSDYTTMSDLAKKCNMDGLFPYLYKRDLQLFLKRLRKRISNNYQYVRKDRNGSTIRKRYFPWQCIQSPTPKDTTEEVQKLKCGEQIRYYACGEYGPKHFRPHFHLLLFFDKLETAQSLQHHIRQSWSYGRIDVSQSLGDCAQYVASYVNGNHTLPQIYQLTTTKPFSTHSYFLGEAVLKSQLPSPRESQYSEFTRISHPIGKSFAEFSLWRSLTTYFYPRCKAYSSLDTSQRVTAYRTYALLSSWSGETRPSKITDIVCRYLTCPDVVSKDWRLNTAVNYFIQSTSDLLENQTLQSLSNEEYVKVKRSIYTELRVSKHFCEYVCSGIYDYPNLLSKVQEIERFYDYKSIELLNTFYSNQELFFEDSMDIDDLVLFYDNMPHDGNILDRYEEKDIFQLFRSHTHERYEKGIKHKKLNDANGIFLNK